MRIGYLVPEFPGQTHAFFWREVVALREQGHDVKLISTRPPPSGSARHEFAESAAAQTTYIAPSARSVVLALALTAKPSRARKVVSYLRGCSSRSWKDWGRIVAIAACGVALGEIAKRESLDHLHVHSCADAAHLAAVQQLTSGVSYSLTLHGDLPVYGVDHESKMKHASFVAAVTRPLQQQVVEVTGWSQSRVPIIQMGVDTDRFAPRPSRTSHDEPLTVVTVARLNPAKGHRFALGAVRRSVDAGLPLRYVIAGEGEARSEIEAQIAELDLGSTVTLLGTLSEDQVLALLHRADVLLLPSIGLGEAAPVAVMEAMACGVAVVCSRIGGTCDMIQDGVTGILVPQMDSIAIEAALRTLATDDDARIAMGSAARTYAEGAFDFRANAARLLAAIGT